MVIRHLSGRRVYCGNLLVYASFECEAQIDEDDEALVFPESLQAVLPRGDVRNPL